MTQIEAIDADRSIEGTARQATSTKKSTGKEPLMNGAVDNVQKRQEALIPPSLDC